MIRTLTIGLIALGMGAARSPLAAQELPAGPAAPTIYVSCPVLKAHVDSQMKAVPVKVNGVTVYACNDVTAKLLKKEPTKLIRGHLPDPVTKKSFEVAEGTPWTLHSGTIYLFASAESRGIFLKSPERYLKPAAPAPGTSR